MADDHIVVHGFDTRSHCVYDLAGHASQMAIGALLETIRIAASLHGLAADARHRPNSPDDRPEFDVLLSPTPGVALDPLAGAITTRSVQRRPLSRRKLTAREIAALEASVGADHRVHWLTGRQLLRTARLTFRNAKLRLTIPEAYRVHRDIIHWGTEFSEDRVPDRALGVDPLTVALMRWAMRRWERIVFLNRYLGGTLMPRLQMDLLPGLLCAAHALVVAVRAPAGINDYIAAGRAMQRFWLTVTQLGLQMQPEQTPLIFAEYVRDGVRFSQTPHAQALAEALASELVQLIGPERAASAVFMCRVGAGQPPRSRSLRLPLEKLMLNPVRRSA